MEFSGAGKRYRVIGPREWWMTNLTSTTNSIESSFNFENIREIVKLCLIRYSSVELVIYIIRPLDGGYMRYFGVKYVI